VNVFEVHRNIIADYENYIRSFISNSVDEIQQKVDQELQGVKLWPEPLPQFYPSFAKGGKVADLARDNIVQPDLNDILKDYSLYHHQLEGLQFGVRDEDFLVTSGTGSGKLLSYLSTIFNHLLCNPTSKGVVAITVYPLNALINNALINSQSGAFDTYAEDYLKATDRAFPITYGRYTGQEN
jgi:ATP-dependent helicase YprA (DUF1998 family)